MRTTMMAAMALAVCVGWTSAEVVTLAPIEAGTLVGEVDGITEPRVLYRFELAPIPRDAAIELATLRLNDEDGVPWETPFVPVIVAAVATDWDGSASWDGPSADGSWKSPGGDWDRTLESYRVLAVRARSPAKFPVTHIVRAWLSGASPNYGFVAMLEGAADLKEVVQLFNAETLKPSLTVRYILPPRDSR